MGKKATAWGSGRMLSYSSGEGCFVTLVLLTWWWWVPTTVLACTDDQGLTWSWFPTKPKQPEAQLGLMTQAWTQVFIRFCTPSWALAALGSSLVRPLGGIHSQWCGCAAFGPCHAGQRGLSGSACLLGQNCRLPFASHADTTAGAGGQAGCSREQVRAGISELPLEEPPSLHLSKATNGPKHGHSMSDTVPSCSYSLFPPKPDLEKLQRSPARTSADARRAGRPRAPPWPAGWPPSAPRTPRRWWRWRWGLPSRCCWAHCASPWSKAPLTALQKEIKGKQCWAAATDRHSMQSASSPIFPSLQNMYALS